jgi:CRP-like cAMP-binding protein
VVVREPFDVAGGLARSYLFEELTAEELGPLAAVVTTRQLVRGEALCRVGDRADEIYVVLSGEVKDSVVDGAGVEVVHFLHGPGMTIGEPGFFAVDHDRLVELIAVAPSVVIRLGRREFEPFIARHPSIKDRVLEKLASNTRWQTTMISSLLSRSLTDDWCCGCSSSSTPAGSAGRGRRSRRRSRSRRWRRWSGSVGRT